MRTMLDPTYVDLCGTHLPPDKLLRNGMRDRDAVQRRCSPSELVNEDQRTVRREACNISSLRQLTIEDESLEETN